MFLAGFTFFFFLLGELVQSLERKSVRDQPTTDEDDLKNVEMIK